MSIVVWHSSPSICLVPSIHWHPFKDVHSLFIPVDAP
jgi:hypothetical protein